MLRDYYEDSGEDAFLMQYRARRRPVDELGRRPVNRIAQYEES